MAYTFGHTEIIANNPYALYPGAWPLCGYRSPIYNTELIRLIDAIHNLQDTKDKILFHLTCGSPIEEFRYTELKEKNILHQKYQMIPEHLWDAAKKGIKVINYIISPNKLNPPIIIKENDFKKIDNNTYIHNSYPLYICIFNTMLPSNDAKRINNKINNLIQNNLIQIYPELDIKSLYQTEDDIKIINIFYNTLNSTITHLTSIGCFCSCFTFAVFNQKTEYYKYNRCALFKELLQYYPDTKMSILCEWVYNINVCCVYPLQNINKDVICYIPQDEFKYNSKYILNGKLLKIDNKNSKLCVSYIQMTQPTQVDKGRIIKVLTKKESMYNIITNCKCKENKIHNIDIHDPLFCTCDSCKIHIQRSGSYDIVCNNNYKIKCQTHVINCLNHPYIQNQIYHSVIKCGNIDYDILDDIINNNFM